MVNRRATDGDWWYNIIDDVIATFCIAIFKLLLVSIIHGSSGNAAEMS